ncbi:MAG: MFS transporter [Chloroflexi bacterium]|nr:MFS transporter [Chloroflexota bacterium]
MPDPGLLRAYAHKIRQFGYNARLYLLSLIISGIAAGIFGLLFNFYILSLGYDEALLGQLLTTSNTTALLTALPGGYLIDLIGRKRALLLAGILSTFAVLGLIGWHSVLGLYVISVGLGLGQSLNDVTLGPFLMENSSEAERTYLFSLSFGVHILAAFVGNWLGGQIPQWAGTWFQLDATAVSAYRTALILVVALSFLSLIPLLRLRVVPKRHDTPADRLAPLRYARQHRSCWGN